MSVCSMLMCQRQQCLHKGMLQKTQEGEEEGVWETYSRHWPWDLYWFCQPVENGDPRQQLHSEDGLIGSKQGQSYSMTLQFIWCKISFSLLIQIQCAYVGRNLHLMCQRMRSSSVTIQLILSVESPGWGTESPPACWQSNWSSNWLSYYSPFYHIQWFRGYLSRFRFEVCTRSRGTW